MHRLLERAQASMSVSERAVAAEGLESAGFASKDDAEELSALRGMTRLVARRTMYATPSLSSSSASSSASPASHLSTPPGITSQEAQYTTQANYTDPIFGYSSVEGAQAIDLSSLGDIAVPQYGVQAPQSDHVLGLDTSYYTEFGDFSTLVPSVPVGAAVSDDIQFSNVDLQSSWLQFMAQYRTSP